MLVKVDKRCLNVHCRIGSLEKQLGPLTGLRFVHCRIGSLEILKEADLPLPGVHCRIGSLETIGRFPASVISVHCRIGSLENRTRRVRMFRRSSLPHRQFRNCPLPEVVSAGCSLPHRQFRKSGSV